MSTPLPADVPSPCPICTSREFVSHGNGLARCVNCRVVVNPSVWTPGADAELEAEWFDGGEYEPDPSRWTRMFARWNAKETWRRLHKAGARGGNVLEIGPGGGGTLIFLRERGYMVQGCDASAAVCNYVAKTHGIQMHHGLVADIKGDGVFDAIVMNHIVEHVSDPVGLLTNVRRLLRPGGILHVAVPNIDSWDAKLPGWTSYQPYHLVYYTPTTLEALVARAGFAVTRVETREPFSGWFLATLRTMLRVGASRSNTRAPRRSPLVENAYRLAMLGTGALTLPLRLLQSALLKGEEAVALATRREPSALIADP